jgi:D-threo-aldose 1-dehydrogenase
MAMAKAEANSGGNGGYESVKAEAIAGENGNKGLKVQNPAPKVTQLMHGVSAFGCLFKEVSEEQCQAAVAKALELGITYFDTAPWYGAGLSEKRLASSLKATSAPADTLVSTKVGRYIKAKKDITADDKEEKGYAGSDGGQFFTDKFHMDRPCADYTGPGIRKAVQQSCERLGIDKIHCIRLHDAEDEERWAEATAVGGAVDTMIALRKEGKVKELSLGMNKSKYILRYLQKYPGVFDNIMLAGCFNLIDNDCVDLLLECQTQEVKIVNVGVFASGLLWGGEHYKYDSAIPDDVKDKVTKWKALAEKYSLSLPQVALNFAFLPVSVEYCAFGTSRAEAVKQNVDLCGVTVPVELWKEAKDQGLIHASVPLPA